MTGKAESQREVKPDPANPKIQNGGFEETIGDPPEPLGWHYPRQMKFVESESAPEGKQYVKFFNADPAATARPCKASPSMGGKSNISTSPFSVAGKDIHYAPMPNTKPERSLPAGRSSSSSTTKTARRSAKRSIGPWRGTFDWQKETRRIEVPPKAREAIVRIGLFGATGEISFDGLEMTAGKK